MTHQVSAFEEIHTEPEETAWLNKEKSITLFAEGLFSDWSFNFYGGSKNTKKSKPS